MFGVVGEQGVADFEQGQHALVGDEVEHRAVLAACRDEPAPTQAGQVIRHARLRDSEPCRDRADRQLALAAEQLQNPQPRRIRKRAEVLRDQVAALRRGRQLKGRLAQNSAYPPSIFRS